MRTAGGTHPPIPQKRDGDWGVLVPQAGFVPRLMQDPEPPSRMINVIDCQWFLDHLLHKPGIISLQTVSSGSVPPTSTYESCADKRFNAGNVFFQLQEEALK